MGQKEKDTWLNEFSTIFFFATFHQHCLVTCGCLTTMPKQSNKISALIYIFDRTPRNIKDLFLTVLFYFYSYVSFLYIFGCLVFKSSLWWHLRQQEKVYWKEQKLCIQCVCARAQTHDTFACLFWILSMHYLMGNCIRGTSNLNFQNCW